MMKLLFSKLSIFVLSIFVLISLTACGSDTGVVKSNNLTEEKLISMVESGEGVSLDFDEDPDVEFDIDGDGEEDLEFNLEIDEINESFNGKITQNQLSQMVADGENVSLDLDEDPDLEFDLDGNGTTDLELNLLYENDDLDFYLVGSKHNTKSKSSVTNKPSTSKPSNTQTSVKKKDTPTKTKSSTSKTKKTTSNKR